MGNEQAVEITQEQVLASVKQELRMSNTDHDVYLMELIDRGVRRIGTTETYTLRCGHVTVEDNRFCLPKEAKSLVALRLNNCLTEIAWINQVFFSSCGCTCQSSCGIGNIFSCITQNGRYIYFGNTVADGTEYEISYLAVNRDCDGLMIVNEEMEQAVIDYACWKFSNMFPEVYTRDQKADWYKDYQFQAARCRGLAAVRSKNRDREQIKSRMNAIISLDQSFYAAFGSIQCGFFYSQQRP